jgi:Ca-activated chloride channel family protein
LGARLAGFVVRLIDVRVVVVRVTGAREFVLRVILRLIAPFRTKRALLVAASALITACFFRSLLPIPAVAQQPIQSAAELVKIDVSIADKQGRFVAGLTQSDFLILDNGVERPPAFFAPAEEPARMLLMIETGPAVYLIHDEHLSAAYSLLKGLDPADQVALVTYDSVAHEILPFTTDTAVPLAAFSSLQYNLGMPQLNFYDSLSTVMDWLRPIPGKRALVLLTTGLDSSGSARWDVLTQKLRSDDVVIFPVALGGSLRTYPAKIARSKPNRRGNDSGDAPPKNAAPDSLSFARADRDLQSLASITGGRAYFPQTGADFAAIYREIASALRHQYVLGIEPGHDGQLHTLSVSVRRPNEKIGEKIAKRQASPPYHVFARTGYLAPAQ